MRQLGAIAIRWGRFPRRIMKDKLQSIADAADATIKNCRECPLGSQAVDAIVQSGLRSERLSHWILFGLVLLYSFWAVLLILQNPGFQYDEALLVLGSVQMRHSPQEIALPHDPHSWVCPAGRCFPLMTVRYVGAIKEYLCLPLFAAFGPSAEIVRLVSMLLGALGIWGIARLIAEQVSPSAAAATAAILAINPAYVDLTVFDNGTVSIWMGAMGLLGLTLALVGLYGLIAYSVSRRTQEIGIRMALGAQRSNVAAMILRQGFVLAIIGIAIGFAASVAVRGILAQGLIGLGTLSPAVLAIVPLGLLLVTMAACYLPARRAAQIDPIRALRWE